MTEIPINTEVSIFTYYLIRRVPSNATITLYNKAVRQGDKLSSRDERLLRFILRHPRLLPSIDAGLALIHPHSEIRRRLYVLFAILESTPIYADYFLPINRNVFYILIAAGIGIRAIWRAIIGVVIIVGLSK